MRAAYHRSCAVDGYSVSELHGRIYVRSGCVERLINEPVHDCEKVVRQLRGAALAACLVGEEFRKALDALPAGEETWFPDSETLAAHLADHPVQGAVILVKGSRGIQMEKVLPKL